MSKALSKQFVDKSESALIAAVEIYNKPMFEYREETFSLLMLNAWELLLKGKVLADNQNDRKVITVYKHKNNKDGSKSKNKYIMKSRSGNPKTIGIRESISALNKSAPRLIPNNVEVNLEALMEIRDNSAHFIHAHPLLRKQVLEIGTASIQNYITLGRNWFSLELAEKISLMLPLSFMDRMSEISVIPASTSENNLMSFLAKLIRSKELQAVNESDYYFAISLDVNIKRTKSDEGFPVSIAKEGEGIIKVELGEKNIREKYPFTYSELTERLGKRYSNFKVNQKYHNLRKSLHSDPKYAKERYLDPDNKDGTKRVFFSSNIFSIFDQHYTRSS